MLKKNQKYKYNKKYNKKYNNNKSIMIQIIKL